MIILDLSTSSRARYHQRKDQWRGHTLRHLGWWLLHNLIVHPILGICPTIRVIRLHDWSSGKLSRRERSSSPPPKIPHPLRWAFHNIVVHAAIGLFPCRATFLWHDRSAMKMGVENWS